MPKRYAIWNKKDPIITPIGEYLSAEDWIRRYPVASAEHITIICAAGEINGAFFSTLGQLVQMYENDGCDFSDCTTPEEKLTRIEEFDAAKEAAAKAAAEEAAMTPTTEERIAAALEYQNLVSMEDATEEV